MSVQYFCSNPKRLQAVKGHPPLNAIDYLEVLDLMAPAAAQEMRQRVLVVHCVRAVSGIGAANVRIDGGVRCYVHVRSFALASAMPMPNILNIMTANQRKEVLDSDDPTRVLIIETDSPGDFSPYRLMLVKSAASDDPPPNFDPLLSQIEFDFKVECPSDFDCKPENVCPPPRLDEPQIDYLARDYASFRRLLLDRLSIIMPDWKERNAADMGVALVEAMSYAGDYLSYYQDAAATEAYLGTARKRVSVRRHAQMVDYPMHDGCNARVWVQVQSNTGDIHLPAGSQLFTKLPGVEGPVIKPDTDQYDKALAQDPEIFETMHKAIVCRPHNGMKFYTWENDDCWLPEGSTRATLRDDPDGLGRLRLRAGDVLVFEEVRSPATGLESEKDPNHRHAVRLTKVYPEAELVTGTGPEPALELKKENGVTQSKSDPVNGTAIVEIEWSREDALPFCLCLKEVVDQSKPGEGKKPVSLVRGNIVLADHGRTIGAGKSGAADILDPLPAPENDHYRPALGVSGVTCSAPYDDIAARKLPAATALVQEPREALVAVNLFDTRGEKWSPRRHLLDSGPFDRDFVVETEDDGSARLRFGDGVLGEMPDPDLPLRPVYRTGNGTTGNIGAGAIAHVVATDDGISQVRNPAPARGGADPESIEQVRLNAPQAFRVPQRAVTPEDYAAAAGKHPDVQKAVATLRWTGSWHTIFISVDRKGGRAVDAAFEAELVELLDRYRLAGHDVEIQPPVFVPLDIAMTICVKPDYFRDRVKQALLEAFSRFFHPDNFTFGQPVYLSQIVNTAMQIPGVRWVGFEGPDDKFQRWGQVASTEIDDGLIKMHRLEIAQLENDRNAPENGRIEFIMEGGR